MMSRFFARGCIFVAAFQVQGCGSRLDQVNAINHNQRPADTVAADAGPGEPVNSFAVRLLSQLEDRKCKCSGNYAIAPAAISATLMMAGSGAKNATEKEIFAALGYGQTILDPVSRSGELQAALPTDGIGAASRLYLQEGTSIAPAFRSTLLSAFHTDVGIVDFHQSTASSIDQINKWVAGATAGGVTAFTDQNAVRPATTMFAVSAFSMAGAWQVPFATEATERKPFSIAGAAVAVPTMRQIGNFRVASSGLGDMVELPLSDGRLALDIIVPGPSIVTGEAAIRAKAFTNVGSASTQLVAVELPVFSVSMPLNLRAEFAAMGMTHLFSPDADFSRIQADSGLRLDDFWHQIRFSVDERGIGGGGAAPSAAVAAPSSGVPTEFHVNRPFIFVVRDRTTGTFLVTGRIADPTATIY